MLSMPPEASTFAPDLDHAMLFILVITIGVVILVAVLMVYLAWRYRAGRNPEATSIRSNVPLEITWIVFPSILAIGIFFMGWDVYRTMRAVPPGAMQVDVVAREWSWSFHYPNGIKAESLRVPVGRPVKVLLHSQDVIHSLYIPAFRVKQDVVPGMTTYAWFQASAPGTFELFCAEYCGLGHSDMHTTVVAMPEADFQSWYDAQGEKAAERPHGHALLEKYGCTGCHSTDGSAGVGPTFKGLYGEQVTVTTDGKQHTVEADRDYLERSILHPGADVSQGFDDVMPKDFAEKISDQDLKAILSYLESLGKGGAGGGEEEDEEEKTGGESGKESAPANGEELLERFGCTGCHTTDGSEGTGPTFKGLYGRTVTVVTDGKERTARADRAYLKRSIVDPSADVSKGFPDIMPKDLHERISPEQLDRILDYLQSLGKGGGKAPAEQSGEGGEEKPAESGEGSSPGAEIVEHQGCLGCHTTDGSRGVGPSFKGLYGRTVTVVTDGEERSLTADDDYLRRSILDPGADVVKGFSPVMPSFQGKLDDAQVGQVIDYLKTLE